MSPSQSDSLAAREICGFLLLAHKAFRHPFGCSDFWRMFAFWLIYWNEY